MNANTGSEKTVTAEATPYVGRFAPAPSGPLHLGSLATALASWLEARRAGGRWLLRIDDLDSSRSRARFAEHFIRILSALGLQWDGAVQRQQDRLPRYAAALDRLRPECYRCGCSRRSLAREDASPLGTAVALHPASCRRRPPATGPAPLRLALPPAAVCEFRDLLQGPQRQRLDALGDPVVADRAGHASYQLAVVVDDADAAVTHVVRGADLLHATAWQLHIAARLGIGPPAYMHFPVLIDRAGAKLSKRLHSLPVDENAPGPWLWQAAELLRQRPPQAMRAAPPSELLFWLREHWDVAPLQGVMQIALSEH